MRDIVDLLRDGARMLTDAADEVERLRLENVELYAEDRPNLQMRQSPDGSIEVLNLADSDAVVGVTLVDGRNARSCVPSNVWVQLLGPTSP